MKNIITILIISFLASSFTFKNEQPVGDSNSYHVMALSGLKMRDLPSLKGKKILTIPYNGEVEVIATGFGALKVKELEDFYIEGEWVQVSYNGKEGYVFNGYLTQFPLPDLNMKLDFKNYKTAIEQYLGTKFHPKGDKFNETTWSSNCKEKNSCICGYSLKYVNNILFKYESCNEEGLEYNIEIQNITLTEAYFIIRALNLNEASEELTRSYDKNTISEYPNGAGCSIKINQKTINIIQIGMTCSC